jgi:cell division septation protein DedD
MKGVDNGSDTIVAAFPTMDKVAIQANPAPTKKDDGKQTTVNNQEVKENKYETTEKTNTDRTAEKQLSADNSQPSTNQFTIVLATYVSQESAERYIKTLAKDGFGEARYVKNGKVSRILYSNYADETAAQQALTSLRKQSSEFAEAWILEQ